MTAVSTQTLSEVLDLTSLSELANNCNNCSLREQASQVVTFDGDYNSPIAIIGMNPGFTEDGTGIPFTGRAELTRSRCVSCKHYSDCYNWQTGMGASRPLVALCRGYNPIDPATKPAVPPTSVMIGPYKLGGVKSAGQLLDDALLAARIDRQKLFLTNTNLCKSRSGDPTSEQVTACQPIKLHTLTLLRPKVIITMGNLSSNAMLKTIGASRITMTRDHGKHFEFKASYGTCTIVPTYHPSYILRMMMEDARYGVSKYKETILEKKKEFLADLKSAYAILGKES